MNIETYNVLITNLPVKQQSFTTKRTTWIKAEREFQWLSDLNERLFQKNETLTISRQDIFETNKAREAIIKTIYWGYTAGMRGNHFVNILRNIDAIEIALLHLSKKSNSIQDFINLSLKYKDVEGLGLSTYSKLLYFFKISFSDYSCLILDQRLIEVFAKRLYSNFEKLNKINYYNAEKKYIEYLHITDSLANKLKTEGDNIELFLFTFGNNLKNIENS